MKGNINKMQKKLAFTIFETLMVMAITAVLVILSLKIFRNADEKTYANLYAKAFKTLNTATYNIQKDVDDFNAEKNLEYQEQGQSGAPDSEKKRFPNIQCGTSCDSTTPTPAQLCSALISDDTGYINATKNSCTVSSMGNFTVDGQIEVEPSFVTTDGMKFYIINQNDSDFFYLWVDINGDRLPNRTKYIANKKRPDVVPFLINKDNGVVVPQGLPVYDSTYMTARVVSGNPELDKDYSIPMTYYEAQRIAFSARTWELDKMSVPSKSVFNSTFSNYKKSTSYDSTIASELKCNDTSGYDVNRDFPPCTVEVSTFTRK